MSPGNWELVDKVIAILKPIFLTTKAAESDTVSIAEVIPLLKKLNFDIGAITYSGIGTLKAEVLQQRRFDKQAAKHHGFECLIPGVASMTL